MIWEDLLSGIIQMFFQFIAIVGSIIVSPIDFLVNFIVPQANASIQTFFEFVIITIHNAMPFINWLLYITGTQPSTWALIIGCINVLILTFIITLPFKIFFSAIKGFKF